MGVLTMYWFALFVAAICNSVANVAFKKAIVRTPFDVGVDGVIQLLLEPWMWLGVLCAGSLLACYLYSLKGIDLSLAYPAVTGLAMLGIVLSGVFTGEGITTLKIGGIALVLAGISLLYQSA